MHELKKSLAKSHGTRAAHLMNGGRHPDEREDRALVKKMVKPASLTGKSHGGSCHAAGGKAKKKPSVQVNVLSAPRGGQAGAPLPAAGMAGPVPQGASLPSRPAVPATPMVPPGRPGGLGALAGVPPTAKHGGKVAKRANGGKITGYDAGAVSGEGRLEKKDHMIARRRAGLV
jgi:hypothetical protein